ncbi:MAG: permease prefix domain 1-containing protein [Armatimonadota bacterium]
MDNSPFQKLVDQATEGLKADHELLLDVRQELMGHLEESAAELSFELKLSPEEAEEQTVAQFGPPAELADQLLAANRRRMTLRSLARIMISWVLVPVMLLAGLALGLLRLGAIQEAQREMRYDPQAVTTDEFRLPAYSVFAPPNGAFNAIGKIDIPENHKNAYRTERFKEYWQKHSNEPEALKMLAYFLVGSDVVFNPKPNVISNSPGGNSTYYAQGSITPADYMKFIAIGMKRDPDNALYPMLMLNVQLSKTFLPLVARTEPGTKIRSKAELERSLKLLEEASKKPRFDDYTDEFRLRMLQRLPQPRYYEQYLSRWFLAGQIDRSWSFSDRFLLSLVHYLAEQGEYASAERVVQQALKLNLLISDSANSEQRQMVTYSACYEFLRDSDKLIRPAYPSVFQKNVAEVRRAFRNNILSVKLEPTEEQAKAEAKHIELMPFFYKTGSAYYRGVNVAQLTPLKRVQSLLAGETIVMVWTSVLAMLLILSSILTFIWMVVGAYRCERVLFLLPDWKKVRNRLLTFVLAPALLVVVLTETGLLKSASFWWTIPGAILLLTPILLEWQQTRKRCRDLGISTPDARLELKFSIIGYGCVMLGYWLIRSNDPNTDPMANIESMAQFIVGWAMMAGSVIIGLYVMSLYGRYYGALNRRLTSLWAGSVLILSLLVTPYMMTREAVWLQRDTLWLGYLGAADGVQKLEGQFEQNEAQHYKQLIAQEIKPLLKGL